MPWLIDESNLRSHPPDVLSTLFCVGNGRSTTRGTLSEERFGAFRGVYLSGLYTRAPWGLVYFMGGPDWLAAFVRPGAVAKDSTRTLDLRSGVLTRTATIESPGFRARIREDRFASLDDPHLMAQRFEVTILHAGKPAQIVLGLDGNVRNHRAKYYTPGQFPNCDQTGLSLSRIEGIRADEERLMVVLKARSTPTRAAASARVRQIDGPRLEVAYEAADGLATAVFTVNPSHAGRTFAFEKLVALTGDLEGVEDALEDGQDAYSRIAQLSWTDALARQVEAMRRFWDIADVTIDGDDAAQLAVRFAIWSTRIAAPLDGGAASVGAKNLTGDWYRGAVFWDMEMFQLPMLCAIDPARAANHVLYRARRLPAARTLAAQDGYDGARYPWHSYTTGLEEPPQLGGFLYQQQHVILAVAWGAAHYHDMTGDDATMLSHGLELLIELCRFWASRVTPKDPAGKYHIAGVCGPDENHPNVTDNAYTNRMAIWLLGYTDRLIDHLAAAHSARVAEVLAHLGITTQARERWRDVAANLNIPMQRLDVPAVCEGYNDLPEPDDSLAGIGADRRFKQADTLMLFQAIPDEFPHSTLEACYAEYAPLCLQTSSLSLSTHALLAIRLGLPRDAMKFFNMTTGADLKDVMGNTRDGIHAAAQGGIWMAAVMGFGGLRAGRDGLRIDPMLPPTWKSLRYRFLYHGAPLAVHVRPGDIEVRNDGASPLDLELVGKPAAIAPSQSVRIGHAPRWKEQGLAAVIFDLDGVLVSTDRFHYLAWKELADELGIPFDEERNHLLRGVSREQSLRIIYGERRLPAPETFKAQCDRKNARYVELVSAMTPADVLPGALPLLHDLRRRGIKVGIASASRNCRMVLDRTRLSALVDAVSDGSCISASKPDPSGFFVASQRLRVLPWNCIGVEDAATGIEAIHRAGMAALGIGGQAHGADVSVRSIADVTFDLLRGLFARHQSPLDPYLQRSLAHIQHEVQAGYAATMSFGQKK